MLQMTVSNIFPWMKSCVFWSILHWIHLTHWGRVTHKLTIIGSDNGLSPERHQAIILTSAGILLIGPLGTNFSEISIKIQTFSLKKIRLKMSSAKCRPFCHGLNVLICVSGYQATNHDCLTWTGNHFHLQCFNYLMLLWMKPHYLVISIQMSITNDVLHHISTESKYFSEDKFRERIQLDAYNQDKPFSLFHLNVHSLRRNLAALEE